MLRLNGNKIFLCLIVTFLLQPTTMAKGTKEEACTKSRDVYEDNYTVNDVRIVLPLGWLFSSVAQQTKALLAGMPIKKGDHYNGHKVNEGFQLLHDNFPELHALPPFRFAFRFGSPHLENCKPNEKTLDIVYRIYSFALADYLSRTQESGRKKEVSRSVMETSATKRIADYFFQPYVDYNHSSGLLSGTKLTIKQPGGLLNKLSLDLSGSTSSSIVKVDATGERNPNRGFIRHAEWHLAYANTNVPSGAIELRQGALVGQFTAATRALGSHDEMLLRFGASVEGGNKQTDLDPRRVPLLELVRSGYGAVKAFVGTSVNVKQHAFKASYGVQVSKAGEGFQVDYVKQIFDTSANLRFRLHDHRPLTIESQFNAGLIHTPGRLPVAEKFFGGNTEQNFLVGPDWVIRGNPVIRSFSQNRFVPTGIAGVLGGDRFFSVNVTVAAPVWGYPFVPKEILTETSFKDSLTTGLSVAEGALRNRILGDTGQFKQIAALVLELRLVVTQLKAELVKTPNPNPNAEIEALLKKIFKPSIAPDNPKVRPSGKFDRVELLVNRIAHSLDPQADEAPATSDIQSLTVPVSDDSDPDLPPLPSYIGDLSNHLVRLESLLIPSASSQIKELRELLDKKGKQISEKFTTLNVAPVAKQADEEAKQGMVYPSQVLNQFLYEANLIAVSPVVTFDAARIGRQSFRGNDPRYSVGAGLRISFVSLDITGGYAWNLQRRPGEGHGALLFKMDISNLFR